EMKRGTIAAFNGGRMALQRGRTRIQRGTTPLEGGRTALEGGRTRPQGGRTALQGRVRSANTKGFSPGVRRLAVYRGRVWFVFFAMLLCSCVGSMLTAQNPAGNLRIKEETIHFHLFPKPQIEFAA